MNFFEVLQTAGYEGSCTSEDHVQRALRLGANSRQYEEIVEWLEVQLLDDREIYACMQPTIMQMRGSTIERAHQFRYEMLHLLVAMLYIVKRRQALILPYRPERMGADIHLESKLTPAHIDFEWVIVDRAKVTGAISEDNFDMLIDALEDQIADQGTEAYLDKIDIEEVAAGSGLYKLSCRGFKQVSDVILALATFPVLWEGEDLCVLPWRLYDQFMFTTAWLGIRRPYGTTEDLFEMINAQNDINITSLGFISHEDDDLYLLQLNVRALSVIQRTGGKLQLGSGHIQVMINHDMGTWTDLRQFQETNNDDSIVSH